MPKEDLIEFEGTVVAMLPDSRFRVRLDNGHETLAYTSGRMKKKIGPVLTKQSSVRDQEDPNFSFATDLDQLREARVSQGLTH